MSERELHVDDDWKSRAQAEKEKAAQSAHVRHGESSHDGPDEMGIPEASIPLLINTLAMQVLSALGQIPDPSTGKAMIYKPLAQHLIDMLGVLEEKTKGNLTADEQEMLTEVLAQLRILYVQVPDAPQTKGGVQLPPGDGPQKSSIVLP